MRTLGLLAALLVLALPGRAKPLEGAAEQVADTLATGALVAEDQASLMDGQDQPEDKEQDMAVSFYGDERLTREADPSARASPICFCRKRSCYAREFQNGVCAHNKHRLCCIRL